MQKILSFLGLAVLAAACSTPTSGPLPAGAVPFAAVLQANAGKPYECADYDPRTRSCSAYGTYTRQADGSLLSEGFFLLNDSPRVVARGIAPAFEVDGRLCTQSDAIELTLLEGAGDPRAEFALGFIEAVFADEGLVCATYTPSGDGYSVTTSGQSGGFGGPFVSTSVFFATAPRLRPAM